jgi:hypothetical protein
MDINQFKRMRQIEKMDMRGLKVGDKFLHGTKMLSQPEDKKNGDAVSYYQVIAISSQGNVEYKVVTENLKES